MTDKELKKLSRLELLELLLEVSKENETLKEKIEELKIENEKARSIENLSAATHKIESALKYANTLTGTLKAAPTGDVHIDIQEFTEQAEENQNAPEYTEEVKQEKDQTNKEASVKQAEDKPKPEKPRILSNLKSDLEIYRRLLCFFATNKEKLNMLPADIRKDVRIRIKSILESKKIS